LTLNGSRYATEAWSNPGKWLDSVDHGLAEKERCALTGEEQASEFLMMGLRLIEGVDPLRYAALAGHELPRAKINELCDIGMIETNSQNLRVTREGRMVLNAVLAELLAD
jgi:oxygen-independent coproporphyrinogen-3 oxidase